MRDHRNNVIAMVERARSAEGRCTYFGDIAVIDPDGADANLWSSLRKVEQLRPDFDPHVVAIATRAAIDAVSPRMTLEAESTSTTTLVKSLRQSTWPPVWTHAVAISGQGAVRPDQQSVSYGRQPPLRSKFSLDAGPWPCSPS